MRSTLQQNIIIKQKVAMKSNTIFYLFLTAVISFSCTNGSDKNSGSLKSGSKKISITAAGATFPMPYYNMVFKEYTSTTGVQVTYGGIGSGGGIRSLSDRVVDFGATDAFLEDDQLSDMPADVLHIPTVIGAVAIVYNLPGVEGLNLS